MNQRGAAERAWATADQATKLLGVKRATLYAYASRGLVRSVPAPGRSRARLYDRADLERLRTRSDAHRGHRAVAAGALLWGEPVLETRVGDIRADGPYYRGASALALARAGTRFEDVCARLWDGPVPDAHEVVLPPARRLLRRRATPFEAMLATAGALAAACSWPEPTVDRAREEAARLVRQLAAAAGLAHGVSAATRAGREPTISRALLVALGGRPSDRSAAALDQALVLTADHELNASTFAVRIAAGAGASLPSSVLAALATLSGPLHGGVTRRVEAMIDDVGVPRRATSWIRARLAAGEAIPGFGHPLYPQGDPRGIHLLALARATARDVPAVDVLVAVARTMERLTELRPTVDVGLVALAAALGLREGAALAIFAVARTAGWAAHAFEQRASGTLLRPRARYVGDADPHRDAPQ